MRNKPDFLIIGAMKAGTTSLFRDLSEHPGIFLPEEKEPETLIRYGLNVEAISKDYTSLFRHARPDQLVGEASTAYTKRPDVPSPAKLAYSIFGSELKLIYLKRDPIKRIISQYKHEYGLGIISTPINEAILEHSRYIAYSQYNWQLEPWESLFGTSNLLILSFEDYIENRSETVRRVCEFLDIEPSCRLVKYEQAFNVSKDKPTAKKGPWKTLINSRFYQRVLKPRIPKELRERIASVILPNVTVEPDALTEKTTQYILERLSTERG